ncbi:MAG: hypothetical protein FLDDKLPJ_03397 [Phycisphaerae bacterium]|nr:hypothetical protein [Phycisphaerae bacterium]
MGAGLMFGCGNPNALIFNDSFLNYVSGGIVPQTPGPSAPMVLVRCVNSTATSVQFVVTAEITQPVRDAEGNPQFDVDGNIVTERVLKTVRLNTFPFAQANELGHVFSCSSTAVERVGLGENLQSTDQGLFIGFEVADVPGFGVEAGLNPLVRADGNFECGDTIIFRAIESRGQPGGVRVESFVLPWRSQPECCTGPDTFGTLEAVIESQVGEDP